MTCDSANGRTREENAWLFAPNSSLAYEFISGIIRWIVKDARTPPFFLHRMFPPSLRYGSKNEYLVKKTPFQFHGISNNFHKKHQTRKHLLRFFREHLPLKCTLFESTPPSLSTNPNSQPTTARIKLENSRNATIREIIRVHARSWTSPNVISRFSERREWPNCLRSAGKFRRTRGKGKWKLDQFQENGVLLEKNTRAKGVILKRPDGAMKRKKIR